MEWKCPRCRERIAPSDDVCWQCGTTRDGKVDPAFQHADDYEPPITEEKPQFRLSTLLTITAASCLVFALCGGLVNRSVNVLTIVLGGGAFLFLCVQFFSWALLNRVRQFQRDVRQSVRQTETQRRRLED